MAYSIEAVAAKLTPAQAKMLADMDEEAADNLYADSSTTHINTARSLNRKGLFASFDEHKLSGSDPEGRENGWTYTFRLSEYGRAVRNALMGKPLGRARPTPLSWYALALTKTEREDLRALGRGEFVRQVPRENGRLWWWQFAADARGFSRGTRELTDRGRELLAEMDADTR